MKEASQVLAACEGCEGLGTCSNSKHFCSFCDIAVTIVEDVVCCVKFSASWAIGLIASRWSEPDGVVGGDVAECRAGPRAAALR
jgi:hypothetical protein